MKRSEHVGLVKKSAAFCLKHASLGQNAALKSTQHISLDKNSAVKRGGHVGLDKNAADKKPVAGSMGLLLWCKTPLLYMGNRNKDIIYTKDESTPQILLYLWWESALNEVVGIYLLKIIQGWIVEI